MLTKKEGLPFRLQKGKLLPKFVALDDPEALEYAGFVSVMLSQALGKRQGQIEEELEELKESFEPTPLRMGLHKICLDKLQFAPPSDFLGPALRHNVFQEAFAIPKAGFTPAEFRTEIQTRLKKTETFALYGDLPSEHVVTEAPPPYSARELLNAYNIGG